MVALITSENELLTLKNTINDGIKQQMAKRNRDFLLQEQLKEINHQLNKGKGDYSGLNELKNRLTNLKLSDEAKAKVKKELAHLELLQPMTPEAGMIRHYLEVIADLPWENYTTDNLSLNEAESLLNREHYGLEKVKERILDFIAVRKISNTIRGPILCLLGPPGVGKTSLAQSIAHALSRNFVRLSLGGMRDESEIRGHRRSYLGALPGKIIQALQKTHSANPVFLLDEIDKMSRDSRHGDPANALLELLDSDLNKNFTDTFIELGFNLSQTLFIATANSLSAIPYPLLDRLEIIELTGYTEQEKEQIATHFIIPKQLKENGLTNSTLTLNSKAYSSLIQGYTNESGVRGLERTIGQLIRKLIRQKLNVDEKEKLGENLFTLNAQIDTDQIISLLGRPKYHNSPLLIPCAGVAVGLAWTERGGAILPIEAHLITGNGKLNLTGKLGKVMQESAQIATSFIRNYLEKEGYKANFFKHHDIHIHAPQGATPKDGPSAGITIACALYSAITGKIITMPVAMTGELSLLGQLLPIGGLKEKALAAHRHHYTTLIIAKTNEDDLVDIPAEIAQQLTFKTFTTAGEVIDFLFKT
jgi:ATP-dependent Lon protease